MGSQDNVYLMNFIYGRIFMYTCLHDNKKRQLNCENNLFIEQEK